jgi:nucleoid-associated protein YgaU
MSVLWRDETEPAAAPTPQERPRAQAATEDESWLEIVLLLGGLAFVLWYVLSRCAYYGGLS